MGQYLLAPDDVERVHEDASTDQVHVMRNGHSVPYVNIHKVATLTIKCFGSCAANEFPSQSALSKLRVKAPITDMNAVVKVGGNSQERSSSKTCSPGNYFELF